jgi:hypothetical protein
MPPFDGIPLINTYWVLDAVQGTPSFIAQVWL